MMSYKDFNHLARRTASDEILRNTNIAKNIAKNMMDISMDLHQWFTIFLIKSPLELLLTLGQE